MGSMKHTQLVVVGNGMVGHKFVEALVQQAAPEHLQITVFGEEPRPAYDRVALSSWFAGTTVEELTLPEPGYYERHGVTLFTDEKVDRIDRDTRRIHTTSGRTLAYDTLVLATGSFPFVPPVANGDAAGTFVYRTIDDLEAIAAWASRGGVRAGAVIGGGLLGLEAANALHTLGLDTHVVEFAERLMPVQVDEGGGRALRSRIERLGVSVHTARATSEVVLGPDRSVAGLRFADPAHGDLDVQLVLYSAGIRPRDELARSAGLAVGERGGVVVDDELRTNDPAIYAIGEVALHQGRIYGLVAPGYDMARTLAANLVGALDTEGTTDHRFTGAELSTKLKLLGIDVASFGDSFGKAPGARCLVWDDPVAAVYKKLVVDEATGAVTGGVLVGDASAYATLLSMSRGDLPTPDDPSPLLLPAGSSDSALGAVGVTALADTSTICSCNNVVKGQICSAVADGCHTMADLKATTTAGTGCGGCQPLMKDLLQHELTAAGLDVDTSLCTHFAHTRAELYSLVRFHGHRTFTAVLANHGHPGLTDGCDICKPTIGSILASLGEGYILDGEQSALQDTNDHFLANLQKDGTYSVVPRIPGGEITPNGLITIGEVARDYGLYTKITGGQRIDLFGARVEQLPEIWTRLVDAGFESGHAYGKALRTVKSCVGETWCRYGVQDSVAMAIAVELRYRGLRAPHKIKMAVSGCTRECAEAQSKDVGIIATERGWNLYVGGNGGLRPQHAVLFAEDLDDATLIRYIDRFLMFYIRTADRLERTASWLNKIEGGLDHVRSVVMNDSLGIADELETDMANHVASYECEWKATIESPERVSRFVSFVNAPDAADPHIVFVEERGQIRPARPEEKPPAEVPVLLGAGAGAMP